LESLIVAGLPARERLLLFCVASGTDPLRAGLTSVLRAMLPDL
jgi:hypothetical protein